MTTDNKLKSISPDQRFSRFENKNIGLHSPNITNIKLPLSDVVSTSTLSKGELLKPI